MRQNCLCPLFYFVPTSVSVWFNYALPVFYNTLRRSDSTYFRFKWPTVAEMEEFTVIWQRHRKRGPLFRGFSPLWWWFISRASSTKTMVFIIRTTRGTCVSKRLPMFYFSTSKTSSSTLTLTSPVSVRVDLPQARRKFFPNSIDERKVGAW